jgi:hypothetical protein
LALEGEQMRGALFICWKGYIDPTGALDRSIASLKRWHPELECHVEWLMHSADLRCKSRMFDLSPFDETLFLDVDTVVLGNLDYGFTQANKHGMALCINANPWARRYDSMQNDGDVIEYNTGVMWFNKRDQRVADVFTKWKELKEMDSSSSFQGSDGVCRMLINDQCSFSAAVAATDFNPFILPVNWNLQPKWQRTVFGPVKVWHTYAPPPQPNMEKWNAEQSKPGDVIKCGAVP